MLKWLSRIIGLWLILASFNNAQAADYEWKAVEKTSIASGLQVTGRIIPQDGALNIESARVQGRILAILKREGEPIQIGTPLFSITSAECFSLQEEKHAAEKRGLQELMEGVARRQKQLGLRVRAGECEVVANHAGVLTKRNAESGASFNAGDPLATILDIKHLAVELDVPEKDLVQLRLGLKVQFHLASDPGKTYTSVVQNIVPTIDPISRTTKVRLKPIVLPGNTNLEALVFGNIETGEEQLMLKVPTSALVFHQNQQFVIKGDAEKPSPVAVEVLNETDSTSAVRPLKDGALVVGDLVATRGGIFLLKKWNQETLQ